MSTIDYSKYSINELFEVKDKISPESSNYDSFLTELEIRKDEIAIVMANSQTEAFSLAENRVKIIGYFQLTAAVFIILYYLSSIADGSVSILSTVITLPLIVLNILAGYTALKENHKYYWLSILNQSLQIPSIAIGSISTTYSGLGGAYVYLSWGLSFHLGQQHHFCLASLLINLLQVYLCSRSQLILLQ
tara:strand:- start:808 stop:1377 length:570 start_codon:yes stop_codon:yes gene_type:complete